MAEDVGDAEDAEDAQASSSDEFDYDLVVLGAGSGGVRASRVAAATGARVAVVEGGALGGTCVNVGCVPKKLFVYASHVRQDLEDAAGFGWRTSGVEFDWPTLRDNKTAEIERLNGIYQGLLEGAGVEIVRGRGRLVDRHTVRVAPLVGVGEERVLRAKTILIAVGGWPRMPEIPGAEHAVSSNEMFYLEELPKRAVIVGGGYIGVEFAGILHGLGVQTTLVYRRDLFLRGFDFDLRARLRDEMVRQGIELVFEADVESISENASTAQDEEGKYSVRLSNGDQVTSDLVLYAIGRVPRTEGLGLEEVGVAMESNGAVAVNALSQTSVENIYAIGDVTDRVNLTPVAIHEAMCLVKTLFEDQPTEVDHDDIPSAVFSQPPIGTVGLTEEQAVEKYGREDVEIYRSSFTAMKYALSENEETTLMKLVVCKSSRCVVGAHMIGADAGEIIQGIGIAVKMRATKDDFDRTIGIHPTSAEEFVTMREPVWSDG